jgi:hypothetical protein
MMDFRNPAPDCAFDPHSFFAGTEDPARIVPLKLDGEGRGHSALWRERLTGSSGEHCRTWRLISPR